MYNVKYFFITFASNQITMYHLLLHNFGSKDGQYRIEMVIDEDNVLLFYYERPPWSPSSPQEIKKTILELPNEGLSHAISKALRRMEEFTGIDLIKNNSIQYQN